MDLTVGKGGGQHPPPQSRARAAGPSGSTEGPELGPVVLMPSQPNAKRPSCRSCTRLPAGARARTRTCVCARACGARAAICAPVRRTINICPTSPPCTAELTTCWRNKSGIGTGSPLPARRGQEARPAGGGAPQERGGLPGCARAPQGAAGRPCRSPRAWLPAAQRRLAATLATAGLPEPAAS